MTGPAAVAIYFGGAGLTALVVGLVLGCAVAMKEPPEALHYFVFVNRDAFTRETREMRYTAAELGGWSLLLGMVWPVTMAFGFLLLAIEAGGRIGRKP